MDTKPLSDRPSERPATEIKRKWAHGDAQHPDYTEIKSQGKDCYRANKPVYTDPNKVPGVCRSHTCSNGEWIAKGRVERVKGTHGDDSKIVREIP
jgi:hypothetical protein